MEAVPPRRLARARGGGSEAAQLPPLGESWPAPVGATHSEPPWLGFGLGLRVRVRARAKGVRAKVRVRVRARARVRVRVELGVLHCPYSNPYPYP